MYLAIDIGGTKTLLAVFDHAGKVVFEHKTATDHNYDKFIKSIDSALHKELKDYDFSYCCCAVPSLIDHERGVAKYFGNLKWMNEPIKHDLEKLLNRLPVAIENDAKLAGLSEALLVQKKYKKVLYLTISTGIGGSVITDGKIDHTLIDAEPGQMVLNHDGKLEKWESFASGKAFYQKYGKPASEVDDPKIWHQYATLLVPGIEQLLAIIQPDAVIIGGGLGAHLEKFEEYLLDGLDQIQNDMVKIPPIIKARRPEEAVIYGCYDLIQQQI